MKDPKEIAQQIPSLLEKANRLIAVQNEVLAMPEEQRDWFMSKPGHTDAFDLAWFVNIHLAPFASAIQARDEERDKEHQDELCKRQDLAIHWMKEFDKRQADLWALRAERDALRKELADCQLVSEDMSIELDKLLEAARLVKGSRDVHNVYEVLDLIPALRKAGLELLTAMETCHICQGTLVPEDGPIHCEDCSSDCEDHEGEPCISLSILRRNLGQLIGPEVQPAGEPK